MAAALGAGSPRPGFPVARALRGAALWIRRDHAGRHLDVAAGFCGPVANLVARGTRDPVLAPYRARAAAGPGYRRPDALRGRRPHEHSAAVVPAARATSVLQYDRLYPDGRGDVLSPLAERG